MPSLSLELKLGGAVLAVCLVTSVAGAALAGSIFERHVEAASLATLQNAAESFAVQERSDVEKLAAALDALLANDDLRDAFVARDRARLLAIAAPLFERMREHDRITHWYFIEADAAPTVFLRVHRPELHGDRVERATLRRAMETQDLGAGKELGQTAFALRTVRPWFHAGKLLGFVELAEEIDHFLTGMKSRTGDEFGLVVKKRFLDEQAWAAAFGPQSSTWNDRRDVVVLETTGFAQGIAEFDGDIETLSDRGEVLGDVELGERAHLRGVFPVRDAAGRKVAALFVLRDFTRHHAAMQAGRFQTFLVLVALGFAAAAAVVALLRWLVFARLEPPDTAGRDAGDGPAAADAPTSRASG